MANQILNVKVPLREGFALIPQMAKQVLELSPQAADLAKEMQGTEVGLMLEVDGEKYGLVIKNGNEFSVTDAIAAPMVKMTVALKDLEKLVVVKNADMLLGQQAGAIDKSKYDTLKGISGSLTTRIGLDDGSECDVKLTFNNADQPNAVIFIKMDDLRALIKKENNPVSLFMSGGIKLEGDMSIAMALQPLMA